MNPKLHNLVGVIVFASTFGLAHGAERAEDKPGAARTQLEEVIITARKKSVSENLEEVPLAVTAMSGEQLEARHIPTLSNLANSIPNVQMDEQANFRGTANFSIRGMGTISSIATLEPTVGVFYDGMYLATSQGTIFNLFDLNSVEVLRGPQGTLFGKNVTGGAVILHSRDPSDQFEAKARAALETGPEYKVSASVTGPMTPTLSGRLSVTYDDDQGWFTNDYDGKPHGKLRTRIVRPSIRWQPTDKVNIVLRYEHADMKGDGGVSQNYGFHSINSFDIVNDFRGRTDISWDMVTSEANFDVPFGDGGVITNVAGYRDLASNDGVDVDGTEIIGFHTLTNDWVKQFSEELRYSGRFNDMLDLTVGLYYFDSDITSRMTRFIGVLGALPRRHGGDQRAHTYGIFASSDIDLTDHLIATVGGRYTRDKKRADLAIFEASRSTCDLNSLECDWFAPGLSDTWNSFSPKLGLQYKINTEAQVYASWTRGYRAGGYNVRLTDPAQSVGFDQEKVDTYEVGEKAKFLDNRLAVNAAAFINKLKNTIRDVTVPVVVGLSGFVQDTRNTADVTVKGAEVEIQAVVTSGLTLSAFAGYLHSHYDKIQFNLIDPPGEPTGTVTAADYALVLPRLSPWTYGAGAEFYKDVGSRRDLMIRADYGHRDAAFHSDANNVKIKKFDSVDASLTLGFGGGRVEFECTLYGRNLLDDTYNGSPNVLPSYVMPPLPPGMTVAGAAMIQEGRVIGFEISTSL